MPSDATVSPSTLVARFLRTNGYVDTLSAFIREAGLPRDVGSNTGSGSWTIEKIIDEKKAYDKTLNFERLGEEGEGERDKWTLPAPSQPTVVETPNPSNLLSASVLPIEYPEGETGGFSIVATSADRHLNLFDLVPDYPIAASYTDTADSPILSCVSIRNGHCLAMTTMSGKLIISWGPQVLDSRKDHMKYAVQVAAHDDNARRFTWIATAGWDGKIFIYCANWSETHFIGEPLDTIGLATNPECIRITRDKATNDLILIASRADSTHLYYYLIEAVSAPLTDENRSAYKCRFLGKQNLAPQSNAWVAFSPSCFAISPLDPGLLAVATSSLPHMKVMIVRLLIPHLDEVPAAQNADVTHAAQALAELATQNREDAAIHVQTSTMAPQTPYSTPQVVWRPDGSGVWVNGDDGVVRGIEAKTGRIMASLTKGHEPGSKIRSLWAGWVPLDENGTEKQEWLLSGGFDKKLIVWKIRDGESKD